MVRKPQFIEFGKIPVNQYNKTIEEEKKNFSREDFIRIYHDMVVIREFETMLNLIKTTNEYNDNYFSFNFPAYWNYKGMSQSAKNAELTAEIENRPLLVFFAPIRLAILSFMCLFMTTAAKRKTRISIITAWERTERASALMKS